KDTAITGSNFASDSTLIAQETTFDPKDKTTSPNGRKLRMEQLLLVDMKGKLDAETGKQVEADHHDALLNKDANNKCVVCGHVDGNRSILITCLPIHGHCSRQKNETV